MYRHFWLCSSCHQHHSWVYHFFRSCREILILCDNGLLASQHSKKMLVWQTEFIFRRIGESKWIITFERLGRHPCPFKGAFRIGFMGVTIIKGIYRLWGTDIQSFYWIYIKEGIAIDTYRTPVIRLKFCQVIRIIISHIVKIVQSFPITCKVAFFVCQYLVYCLVGTINTGSIRFIINAVSFRSESCRVIFLIGKVHVNPGFQPVGYLYFHITAQSLTAQWGIVHNSLCIIMSKWNVVVDTFGTANHIYIVLLGRSCISEEDIRPVCRYTIIYIELLPFLKCSVVCFSRI